MHASDARLGTDVEKEREERSEQGKDSVCGMEREAQRNEGVKRRGEKGAQRAERRRMRERGAGRGERAGRHVGTRSGRLGPALGALGSPSAALGLPVRKGGGRTM